MQRVGEARSEVLLGKYASEDPARTRVHSHRVQNLPEYVIIMTMLVLILHLARPQNKIYLSISIKLLLAMMI